MPGTQKIRFVHGLYGDEVDGALDQVKEFIKANTKEVVILDFNHFYNMDSESHGNLLERLRNIFSNQMVRIRDHDQMGEMSLTNIWETQQRILVFYNHNFNTADKVWPPDMIQSPWPNKHDPTKLRNFLEEKYNGRNDFTKFFVFQGVLTPTTGVIVKHPCGSLQDLNATEFVKWLGEKKAEEKRACERKINICIADFVDKGTFIPTVLSLND